MASQLMSRAAFAAAGSSLQTLSYLGVGPTARAIATSGRGPAVAAVAAATILGASFSSSVLAKSPSAVTVSLRPEPAGARRESGPQIGLGSLPEPSSLRVSRYVALSLTARALSGPYGVFMHLLGRRGAERCLESRCAARIRSASCGCGRVRCVSPPPSAPCPPPALI